MQIGDGVGQLAVHFLRKGGVRVAGAKPGFDMTYGNHPIKRRQCRGQGGGGVAVNKNAVGLEIFQHVHHPRQYGLGNVGQVLVFTHDVEVVIGTNVEQPQNLIKHGPVLGGNADPGLDPRGFFQGLDDGSHFNGLRTRSENAQHSHFGLSFSSL